MKVLLRDGPVSKEIASDLITEETQTIIIQHINCACKWCKWQFTDHIYSKFIESFGYQYSRESE